MSRTTHAIVTHAGAFHADEVMAIVLLEAFHLARPLRMADALTKAQTVCLVSSGIGPETLPRFDPDGLLDARTPTWVVRTRSRHLLDLAKARADVFVIDVGGQLDPERLNFDHHQDTMQDAWPDGTPLSSAGLVWLWLKDQGHLPFSAAVQAEMESSLIRPLDAHDNGVGVCLEAVLIGQYNRPADDAAGAAQFEAALRCMAAALDNHRHRAESKLTATRILEAAWQHAVAQGDTHVVLAAPIAYPKATALLDEISAGQARLLAIPGKDNRYSVISLPIDTEFSIRCPTPTAWRGRMGFTVPTASRVVQVAFAHKTGFMCVVEGSAQDAHALARHIIAHQAAPPDPSDATRLPGPSR